MKYIKVQILSVAILNIIIIMQVVTGLLGLANCTFGYYAAFKEVFSFKKQIFSCIALLSCIFVCKRICFPILLNYIEPRHGCIIVWERSWQESIQLSIRNL